MKRIRLSEKIKKAPRFLTIEPYLREQDNPVSSHPEAREPRLVPLVVIDYGSFMARLKQTTYKGLGKIFIETLKEMTKSANSIRDNPYTGKMKIDDETLAELEIYAKSLGVSEIGYTEVNTRYIFRDFRILYQMPLSLQLKWIEKKLKAPPTWLP